jgi:chemotaxis protein MotB
LVILLLAGGVIGGLFFVWPMFEEHGRLSSELATAQVENQKLATRVSDLERMKSELEASQAELAVTVQLKEQALAEITKAQEELAKKLETEIAQGDVAVKMREGQLVVDLVDQILFDSGEAELNDKGKAVLLKVGETMVKMKDKVIQVGGHTDDVRIADKLLEKFPSNWELSTARATNVVRFLQDTAKVPGERLVAAGFSQYRPIAGNSTKTGRKRNRRIEVTLLAAPTPEKSTAAAAPKKK